VTEKTLAGEDNKSLTVGIDGSLFIKGHRYGERLKTAMPLVCDFADTINFVRSSDGSGVGAAVIAAAVSQ
jgi:hexokinase